MNIAITNKDLRQLFSLFPAIVSEFQDCMRVFLNDNYYVPKEERDSPIFLAKRKYASNMNSIISVSNRVTDYLEDYTGEINDSSACLDLIRGLVIYGANRRKEVDRASKTAKGESFIVSENHATNIYGFSLFEKTSEDETDKIEDLTYIFDSATNLSTLKMQLDTSIAKGVKALTWLTEDGKKIDAMKAIPPKLHSDTQNIRIIAALFYDTYEWVQAFAKKHIDKHDVYEIYQYFFLFYASFARKFYANHWQYRVENHEALNIHGKLVACLK